MSHAELNGSLQQPCPHRHHHSHSPSLKQELPLKEAFAYSQTASCFNLQHTKRKVISGFVAELTNELENS